MAKEPLRTWLLDQIERTKEALEVLKEHNLPQTKAVLEGAIAAQENVLNYINEEES